MNDLLRSTLDALVAAGQRVLGAPILFVGTAIAQWAAAWLVAAPVLVAVTAATEGFAPGTRPAAYERILAVVAELVLAEPSVAAVLLASLGVTAMTSAVLWTLLSGGVIARFWLAADDRPSLEAVGGLWLRRFPSVTVQSLWHFGLRAVVMLAATTAAANLPEVLFWPVIVITLLLCIVALDVVRAGAVRGHGQPFHPRTTWRAFAVALRTPTLALPAALLAAAGLTCSGATVLMALWTLGDPTWLWGARGLSAVTLALGLARVAFVTHHPSLAGLDREEAPSKEAASD